MFLKVFLFPIICLKIFWFINLFNLSQWIQEISSFFLIIFIGWHLTASLLNKILRKHLVKIDPNDKVVLITGCDTGFGYLFAKHLNKIGYYVFASCLSEINCEKLKNDCINRNKIKTFVMNVTKNEDIDFSYKLIEKFLNESNKKFWGIINNAGIARCGEIEFGKFDKEFKDVFDVNTFGMVKITRKFLPLLRKHNKNKNSSYNGRIININSLAGRCTISPTTTYSMTKHACIAFTDALRNELFKFNIKVISIEPYYYKTNQTNSDQILNNLKDCWLNTDIHIKQDYGIDYDNEIKKIVVNKEFRKSISNNSIDVAKIIEEALSSIDPDDRYICADIVMKIGTFFLGVLPREFVDIFIYLSLYFMKINKK